MVPRRFDLRRHRPGLQRLHAGAAGGGHRHHRQRRHAVPAPPAAKRREREDRRSARDRARSRASARGEARASRGDPERAHWRGARGHQRARLRRREVRFRRQDRNRTALHDQGGREIPGRQGRRAPARPRMVPRVCTGRPIRRSQSQCWSRTAASGLRPRPRSRAPCSITTCSASRPAGCRAKRGPTATTRATDGQRDRPPRQVLGTSCAPRRQPAHGCRGGARRRGARHALLGDRAERRARNDPGDFARLRAPPDVDRRQRLPAAARAHRAAVVRGFDPAAGRGGPGRDGGQRLAPLAQPRHRALPAFGADEDRAATDARVVLPEARGANATSATLSSLQSSSWCRSG